MRRNLPTTSLWREIVEYANQGILVLNDSNLVIYGNDEAATLLGYRPRDLLGLDSGDILSLFYEDRLDFRKFSSEIMSQKESVDATHEVATTNRRLYIRLVKRELDDSPVTILYINSVEKWQSELVAEAVLSEGMRGNLEMSVSALETLLGRLHQGGGDGELIHPYEIESLVNIMREGIGNTLSLWQQMENFYYAAQKEGQVKSGQADILKVLASVIDHREIRSYQPVIELHIPPGLPSVAATESVLYEALESLVDALTSRLTSQDVIVVSAEPKGRYVYIRAETQTANGQTRIPDGYAIDTLPLAMTEQIIIRYGGRLWSEADSDSLILMLPTAS